MFQKVTWRSLVLAGCAGLLACEAGALTLGRPRGAVLIGRPLEVAIPVTVDTGDAGGPCASAEVFHGENRVGRAPSVRWEPESDSEGVLRVSSSVPVDEPVVTLYLRVGCSQSTTRRFVLLPEVPPDVEPQRPAPPIVPGVTARSLPAPAPAPAPVRAAAAGPLNAEAPPATARRKDPAPRQARLQLEPLDLGTEREPSLRLSHTLSMEAGAPQSRDTLAALWQAMARDPEEAARESLRLRDVERELGSLRELTRQNAAALQEMRAQVAQAQEGRRSASQQVLALVAVLAALGGWLAWRRHRAGQLERVGRWFETHGQPVERVARPPLDTAAGAGAPASAPALPSEHATVPAPFSAPMPMPAAVPVSDWGGGYGFNASRGGPLRMVGVEELIDVHDKADFFLSIGETGQAVAVLEAHLQGPVETGALAWMDLLELYHSLGRRDDYERLRAEFRERFTADVPGFDRFGQAGAPLEDYPRALSRIVALWPSRRVLDVIDESIFRKPGLPGAEAFSLEAYRELVLLYHIAQEVAPAERVTQGGPEGQPTDFPATSLQPLDALDRTADLAAEREQLLIPPASKRLGVDIDLGELPPGDLLDFDISAFDPVDPGGGGRSRDA